MKVYLLVFRGDDTISGFKMVTEPHLNQFQTALKTLFSQNETLDLDFGSEEFCLDKEDYDERLSISEITQENKEYLVDLFGEEFGCQAWFDDVLDQVNEDASFAAEIEE